MKELSLNNCRLDKRYDIFDRLGRGSYAEIFIARDTMAAEQSPHRLVAVKALNVFLQDDLDAELERTLVENFQNEAIALDRVRHPNIISRLGHGTARDVHGTLFHYLVLEYLQGGDLQKLLRDEGLSFGQAFVYLEQVCAGLRHAHLQGVIHRDIKPQNLLLTKDRETVKIADFGVARLGNSDAPITRVGTNIYAAPEHSPMSSDGDAMVVSVLTPAADIYSLAKCTYTLLTREAPRFFANQQITEIPLAVREKPWAGELKRVLARATCRNPEERHSSIDELWHDLGKVRRFADEGEIATHVRSRTASAPQPHFASGYSPIAPKRARFNTSRQLDMRQLSVTTPLSNMPLIETRVSDIGPVVRPQPPILDDASPRSDGAKLQIDIPNAVGSAASQQKQKNAKMLRRFAAVTLALGLFAGGLFVTHSSLQGSGYLPEVGGLFRSQTGRANTDINLRPAPNLNNEPIGLVTRNSRVKIVRTENNWHQVDVIEQGRVRANAPSATRGWLNGKYVDLDEK
ncbi:MAG TPA: serine/threonine protein kinase [Pyrinomonadaceae bacterium]|nr:serine/threonine protein kinase [Pyrinomonadaceae bacterium]